MIKVFKISLLIFLLSCVSSRSPESVNIKVKEVNRETYKLPKNYLAFEGIKYDENSNENDLLDLSPSSLGFKKIIRSMTINQNIYQNVDMSVDEKSIEGVDKNKNIIRDKLEKEIYDSFAIDYGKTNYLALIIWYAWNRQMFLNYSYFPLSRENYYGQDKMASICISLVSDAIIKEKGKISFNGNEYFSLQDALDSLIYDTAKRIETRKSMEVPGSFVYPSLSEQVKYCRINQ